MKSLKNMNSGKQEEMAQIQDLMKKAEDHQKHFDFQQAIQCYDAVIDLDSKNALAYHKRGWSRAIACDSGFAQAYADRAMTRFTLKDNEGAMADINKALALKPHLKNILLPIRKNILFQ